MNVALVEQLLSVLVQGVELGIKYGPQIIADLKMAIEFATSGTTLTPDQIAQAEQAVQAAHAELQAQIAQDAVSDATVA